MGVVVCRVWVFGMYAAEFGKKINVLFFFGAISMFRCLKCVLLFLLMLFRYIKIVVCC